MPDTTPNRGLPYPLATDPPSGHLQIQALAEALDAVPLPGPAPASIMDVWAPQDRSGSAPSEGSQQPHPFTFTIAEQDYFGPGQYVVAASVPVGTSKGGGVGQVTVDFELQYRVNAGAWTPLGSSGGLWLTAVATVARADATTSGAVVVTLGAGDTVEVRLTSRRVDTDAGTVNILAGVGTVVAGVEP